MLLPWINVQHSIFVKQVMSNLRVHTYHEVTGIVDYEIWTGEKKGY